MDANFSPSIRVNPPGPKAKGILEKDRRYLSPSLTRAYPFVMDYGKGIFAYDVDGNRYVDMTAGVAVNVAGHAHPEITQAIREQSEKFIHMAGTDFYNAPMADLAERLAAITPGKFPKQVFLSNSGTEAIEAAIKLARYATGRPRMLAFIGGFHGRSMGSLALTASKATQRRRFSPLLSDVTHVPYPYEYRFPLARQKASISDDVIAYIEEWIFAKVAPPEDVAACFVESIQGEGGYIVPPPDFFQKLRALCDRYGILLVADEIQTGLGRTGKMWAIEHWNVVPDILCTAKGLASGIPIGATIARAELHRWPSGAHANTFGGNALACAVALKTLDLIENGLMGNASRMGEFLTRSLDALVARYDVLGERRGLGLMQGVEVVESKSSRLRASTLRDRIVERCFEEGVLLLGCGDSSIRFLPSLTVEQGYLDAALKIFQRVLDEVTQKRPSRTVAPSR